MVKDPLDVHLGARLQELRERRGLSMSAVGREIRTTYQQVRKYETGENRISASTLFRLSEFLGVEIAEFFRGAPGAADAPALVDGAIADGPGAALDLTLARIEDRDVRQHMSGLLRALGGRG